MIEIVTISKKEADSQGINHSFLCEFHQHNPDQNASQNTCLGCKIISDPCGCGEDEGCVLCEPRDFIDNLCKDAFDRWGFHNQKERAIEEMGELIVKLAKEGRAVNGCSIEEVAEEIVDVEIMIHQLKILFPTVDYEKLLGEKLQQTGEQENLIENYLKDIKLNKN